MIKNGCGRLKRQQPLFVISQCLLSCLGMMHYIVGNKGRENLHPNKVQDPMLNGVQNAFHVSIEAGGTIHRGTSSTRDAQQRFSAAQPSLVVNPKPSTID